MFSILRNVRPTLAAPAAAGGDDEWRVAVAVEHESAVGAGEGGKRARMPAETMGLRISRSPASDPSGCSPLLLPLVLCRAIIMLIMLVLAVVGDFRLPSKLSPPAVVARLWILSMGIKPQGLWDLRRIEL
jgi:hypothetical protein